ncbi:hypothetical protein BN7_2347 [Wickerhamomyces ciferrii]|uniref:Uncharacterized protein n=1 Tax=Wickerhamomyces ciferrii (strain ATCC 14091 / BCRC 22168 / CBS 111 / JCM 3599 / NBRC 0793 / NRRL Y-1031 F-60-10) TaxID=1206466 RepID=K0KNX9_WICCF|nr:uncharacterized protein BN7_2347 [Wickerhamomyces ciferrii]CCH42803.1 hypothetical protein BN7_2347 [Wickerhamomyces ciferrii]
MNLTKDYSYATLPIPNRLLLGFCMVSAGILEYGLHHISMALEFTPHHLKCLPEVLLGQAYDSSGLSEIAEGLYSQTNVEKLELLLEKDQKELESFISKTPILENSILKPKNPHHTLKMYLLQTNDAIDKVVPENLEECDQSQDFLKSRTLDKLSNLICRLSPTEDSICPLLEDDEKLDNLLNYYTKDFGSIDGSQRQENVIQYLLKLDDNVEKYSQFVRWWFITTYLILVSGENNEIFHNFHWLLKLHEIALLSNIVSKKDYPKLNIIMKCSSLVCARASLVYDNLTMDKIDSLIVEILKFSYNFDSKREYLCGRTEYFFVTMSLLYQRKSILNLKEVGENRYEFLKPDLEQTLRNLIILATIIPLDNSLISRIYDEISTCIILHGQLHLKIIWIFSFLKSFFSLTANLTYTIDCDYYSNLSNFNDLNEQIKDRIFDIKSIQFMYEKDSIVEDVEDVDHLIAFMIPRVKVISGEHELIDVEFPDDFKVMDEKSTAITHNNKTNELIQLWISSFLDYNESIPKDIYKFLKKFNINIPN